MKPFILGLVGLAALVASRVLGQAPLVPPPAPNSAVAPGLAPAGGACSGGGCSDQTGGCVRTKDICVPTTFTRKTTKAVYGCGCEPFCVDYPFGFFKKCSCCDNNNPKPRYKKYLIKKVRTTECQDIRCVPAKVPACDQGCSSGICPAPKVQHEP